MERMGGVRRGSGGPKRRYLQTTRRMNVLLLLVFAVSAFQSVQGFVPTGRVTIASYLPHQNIRNDAICGAKCRTRNNRSQVSMGLFSSSSAGRKIGDADKSPRKRRMAKFFAASSTARGVTGKILQKARAKIASTMIWTRRKRRNMLAAAALLLSALSFNAYHQPAIATSTASTAPSAPQVVRLASSESNSAAQYNIGQSRSTDRLVMGKTQIGRAGGSTVSARAKASPNTDARAVKMANNPGRISSLITKKQSHTQPPMAAISIKKKETKAEPPVAAVEATKKTLKDAITDLRKYMEGPKSDTMLLLLATALVTPLCKQAGISPILGFLAAGMMLGPNAAGLIKDVHNIETLAELGIVFFLFEMGIELSVERLKAMKRDVFGLGLSQFMGTSMAIAAIGKVAFNLPANALVVLGGGLALSSSAFVLQLLKDKEQLSTRFGKASFGILLLQDLAVVPLLVVTPILAGGGQGLSAALGSALVKAILALSSISFVGHFILDPLFNTVAKARTQEAFLGVTFLTVLGMSFMTEGLGLSNTLGAFLAGVLLSETKYRYQIEADIAPFRGILLGLFFVTVGFEIDVGLVLSQLPLVSAVVLGIIAVKAAVATLAAMAFGLSLSTSIQTALIVSQAGEFAFVAFGLAKSFGILDKSTTKFLLTCVSLTMALTPFLASLGGKIAKRLEEESGDVTVLCDLEREAEDRQVIESEDFVIVVGYGVTGKVVTELLQMKFIPFECLEIDPDKALEAREKGLPVFYGDAARPEIAEAFKIDQAKAVIVTPSDKADTTRVAIALRRQYPDLKIFARAADADHAQRLQKTLDVVAMVPIVPEDNVLLTLPFGGAVLKSLGAQPEEVNAILETKRKAVLDKRGLAESEQEATLAQLGIMPGKDNIVEAEKVSEEDEENDDTDDSPASSSSKSDEEQDDAIEEMKEKSPMVAEVIEAAISPAPAKKESPTTTPTAPTEGDDEE